MKLSVIIPAYNVEQYVERCIVSCEQQDLPASEYELLVINDGSQDRTLDVINRLAKEYDNIKVFSQENKGLSAARNLGMKYAQGEYVCFVDSDDWLAPHCLGQLCKTAQANHLDVLLFDCADVSVTGNITMRHRYPLSVVGNIQAGEELLRRGEISMCVCGGVISTFFLREHDLHFMEGVYHEDNEFTPRMLYFAKRVLIEEKAYYNVFCNMQSITRSVNPKKSYDLLQVAASHIAFMNRYLQDDKQLRAVFCGFVGLSINSALSNIYRSNDCGVADKFYGKLLENSYLFEYMRQAASIKYKVEGWLFHLSPRLFRWLYEKVLAK